MSYRRTVFWSVVAAIALVATLEALLDLLVERLVADHRERVLLGLADPEGPLAQLFDSPLLLDLIDLPLFLLLAFLIAWWLSRMAARPLRTLTHAVEQLASERFPEPLSVPGADDELARLARSFNDMSAAVRGFLERERALTRYATHELRTPLSAIKLQLERARRSQGTEAAVVALDAMERNVRRMEEVLEALLALARSGDRDRTPRPLAAVIDETLAAFPSSLRAQVELISLPPAMRITDGHLVQRALHNLVENALTHGARPTYVHLHRQDADLVLRVRDGGPGVPETALRQLPRPYFRADEYGGGLGVGLSLVTFIAKALGGRIELRNLSPGFEATLSLPVVVEG